MLTPNRPHKIETPNGPVTLTWVDDPSETEFEPYLVIEISDHQRAELGEDDNTVYVLAGR